MVPIPISSAAAASFGPAPLSWVSGASSSAGLGAERSGAESSSSRPRGSPLPIARGRCPSG